MKQLILISILFCCTLFVSAARFNQTIDIKVGNETRKYRLYVPNNVKASAPLIFALHGTGGNCEGQQPNMNGIADQNGCIVAYLQGETFFFPVFGGSVPGWHASGDAKTSKDVEFFKAVIEDINSRYTVNRKRIYCCGFSNGGMMTYTMADQCSDIFAAFAAISGYPINEFHLHTTGHRPVPFLHIHGKADDFVRYALYPTIRANMIARCGAHPIPTVRTVSGKYTKSTYAATEGGFPYISYEVDGMGHNDWTANTEDGNSAETMWKFLSKYTLDSKCDSTLKWRPGIDAEGFPAKDFGWTINSGKTLAKFGGTQKTDANQNVYPSLQLAAGQYKLSFNTQGEEGKQIAVRLRRISGGSKVILRDTVTITPSHTLFFEVKDNWGEYEIQFTRMDATDDIQLSAIEIHSLTSEEATSLSLIPADHPLIFRPGTYDLAGRQVSPGHSHIAIRGGRKFVR